MANTWTIRKLGTMEGRFRFLIEKSGDWLSLGKDPDQQNLTQLFKSVVKTNDKQVQKWCIAFKTEVQDHIGKDDGEFGKLDLYERVCLLVFSGAKIPPDLHEKVKGIVTVDKNHVVEIRYDTKTISCPYDEYRYFKHKKRAAKEERDREEQKAANDYDHAKQKEDEKTDGDEENEMYEIKSEEVPSSSPQPSFTITMQSVQQKPTNGNENAKQKEVEKDGNKKNALDEEKSGEIPSTSSQTSYTSTMKSVQQKSRNGDDHAKQKEVEKTDGYKKNALDKKSGDAKHPIKLVQYSMSSEESEEE